MNEILNQIRRIFSDNGSADRNFTKQEQKLKEANDKLQLATKNFIQAADMLSDLIRSRGLPD